jgi:hypothetical protein
MQRYVLVRDEIGAYELHGALWQLGPFGYRACLCLIPRGQPFVHQVIEAAGVTAQGLVANIATRVDAAVGVPGVGRPG